MTTNTNSSTEKYELKCPLCNYTTAHLPAATEHKYDVINHKTHLLRHIIEENDKCHTHLDVVGALVDMIADEKEKPL